MTGNQIYLIYLQIVNFKLKLNIYLILFKK